MKKFLSSLLFLTSLLSVSSFAAGVGDTFGRTLPIIQNAFQFVVNILLLDITLPGPGGSKGAIPLIAIIATFTILYAVIYASLKGRGIFANHERGAVAIAVALAFTTAFLSPVPYVLKMFIDLIGDTLGVFLILLAVILLLLIFPYLGGLMFSGWNSAKGGFYESSADVADKYKNYNEKWGGAEKAEHETEKERLKNDAEMKSMQKLFGSWNGQQKKDMKALEKSIAQELTKTKDLLKFLEALKIQISRLSSLQSGDEAKRMAKTLAGQISALIPTFKEESEEYKKAGEVLAMAEALTSKELSLEEARKKLEANIKTRIIAAKAKTGAAMKKSPVSDQFTRYINKLENITVQKTKIIDRMKTARKSIEDVDSMIVSGLNEIRDILVSGDFMPALKKIDHTISEIIRWQNVKDTYKSNILTAATRTDELTTEIDNLMAALATEFGTSGVHSASNFANP